jgi:hypothetical protein
MSPADFGSAGNWLMSKSMTSLASLLFVPITPDGPRFAQPTT